MIEVLALRLVEQEARKFLTPDQGTLIGEVVRSIEVPAESDLYWEIARRELEAQARGAPLVSSYEYRREYTEQEVNAAEAFQLRISSAFEPAGEEVGTAYVEESACPHCGFGRTRVSPLRLDLRRAPKADFARTIADEWVVSQRLAEILVDERVTGLELAPVQHRSSVDHLPMDLRAVPSGRDLLKKAEQAGVQHPSWEFDVWLNRGEQSRLLNEAWSEWRAVARLHESAKPAPPRRYELIPGGDRVAVAALTRFGNDPFDDDEAGEHQCPRGHVAGLNILSELHVVRSSYRSSDFAVTDVCAGWKTGLLRPAPLMVISPRLRKVLEAHQISGYTLEVAHIVG